MALEQRKRIDELMSITPEEDTLLVGQRPGEEAGSFPASELTDPLVSYFDNAISSLLRDLSGELVTSGTSNAFEVASVREPLALTDGFAITFRADRNCTGASTLKVSTATAAKPLQKEGAAALVSGDIAQHAIYAAIYVEGDDAFRIKSVPLAAYAKLASPALTGTPTAPTASVATNTTQVATTAFVQSVVAALVASSPAALDTLNELAAALGNDANFSTTVTNNLALKAPLASPALTGSPTAPSPPASNNSTRLATTAWTLTEIAAAVGASTVATRTITAAGSITASDRGRTIYFNSATNITVTLDAAATLTDGFLCRFKNINVGVITIDPNGAELIDDLAQIVVPKNDSGVLVCNGSSFRTQDRPVLIELARATIAAGSLLDFVLPDGFSEFLISADCTFGTAGAKLLAQVATVATGGSSLDATSSYRYASVYGSEIGGSGGAGSGLTTSIQVTTDQHVGASHSCDVEMNVKSPRSSNYKHMPYRVSNRFNAGNWNNVLGTGFYFGTSPLTRLCLYASTGTIGGTTILRGLR